MKRIQPHTLGLYSVLLAHQGSSYSRSIVGRNSGLHRVVGLPQPRSLYVTSNYFSGSPLAASSKTVQDVDSSGRADSVDQQLSSAPVFSPPKTTGVEDFEGSIAALKDVDSLLNYASDRNLSLKSYCQIMFSLGQCVVNSRSGDAERDRILADKRFDVICTALRNAEYTERPQLLLQALKGCSNIGLPVENDLKRFLENELKWVVRRCPIKVVARAIAIFSSPSAPARMSKSNTKLTSSHPFLVAVDSLQRRWVEVTTGGDFIATFNVISQLNTATRAKIEDRAVELVQEFTPMEMLKIFIALGSQKRRPTPLLRTLAFHLSKTTEKIPAKDWIELMYAMNELSFSEPVLMSRMCTEITAEIPSINNPSLISSLVTSLGQLRYKNKEILLALDEWIMKHEEELRPFDRAAWLLTSATLNWQTPNTEKFCANVRQVLTKENTNNPLSWVNIVHSLLVLDQAKPDLLASALESKLVSSVDALEKRATGAKIKLLNIDGASKSFEGYVGPTLSPEVVEKWKGEVGGPSDTTLHDSVVETLSNFLPPPKYLKPGRLLDNGVFVDAFCKLNEKRDPVPVDSKDAKKKLIETAFIVQSYSMYTTGVKEPIGAAVLAVKLLQRLGYDVIAVPYTEFSPQEKLIRRVQYLEQKLRSVNSFTETTAEPSKAS